MHFAQYHQLVQEGKKGGRQIDSLGKYQKNSVGSGGIGGRIEENKFEATFWRIVKIFKIGKREIPR